MLHHLFEQRAATAPGHIALRAADGVRSYAELNVAANRLARQLRVLGVGPETLIGICTARTTSMVVAMLAVLKAGGAYLPLDPEYPQGRLQDTLADAEVLLTLTDAVGRAAIGAAGRVHDLEYLLDAAEQQSAEDLGPIARPEHLAYVIYTSGSSGTPKGVEIEHRQISRLFSACAPAFTVDADDIWACVHSIAFDASIWEIWGALTSGAVMVLVPRETSRAALDFLDLLANERVSVLLQTPAALRLLNEAEADLARRGQQRQLHLRLLLSGGEAMDHAALRDWFGRHGDVQPSVFNAYGPTEVAVISTLRRLRLGDLDEPARSPIGAPLADLQCTIRAEPEAGWGDGVGELLVGGDGVARGYRGRSELTNERFLTDARGRRFYRTGDLVCYLADGGFGYVGRVDRQVKLRGYRIELEEIEAVLCRLPGIAQAVVSLWRPSVDAEERLLAHVVCAGDVQREPASVRADAAQVLPVHMLPAAIVCLPSLPMNASGKIDRAALPAPGVVVVDSPSARVMSDAEQGIAELWSEILGVPVADADADFFALGGSSLSAVRLTSRLGQRLGRRIDLSTLLSAPTVAGLCAALVPIDVPEPEPDWPSAGIDFEARALPFALTAVQQAYWLGRDPQFALGGVATHAYAELVAEDLDVERFERAWNRLITRHGMLRMVIGADGQQRILEEVPYYSVVCVDARGASGAEQLAQTRARLSHQVLPAITWPLFELCASRVQDQRWLLHFSVDALALDLGSIHLLSQELSALYRDPAATLAPLHLSFRDYVLAEQQLRQLPRYRRARDYWLQRLVDLPAGPELPLALDPSTLHAPRFKRLQFQLPSSSWLRLKHCAQTRQLAPTIVLAGVYAQVLCRFARTAHFCLNFTLFNRLPVHAQVDALVGDFTSLTLLEVDWRVAGANFLERLKALQQQMWRDLDHREFSGPEVQQALARERGANLAFPVVVTSGLGMQLDSKPEFDIYSGVQQTQTPQVWLDFLVSEDTQGLSCNWDYVDGLFRPGVVEAMFASFTGLLSALATDEALWTASVLDTLPAATQQLLAQTQGASVDLLGSLQHLQAPLLARMRATPDAIAVQTAAQSLTYRQLDRASARLALALAGVQPNELVAVLMPKHWAQVVAVLGILRAGAAYLPIDASLPAARIAELLHLGEVRRIVSVAEVASGLGLDAVVIDADWLEAPAQALDESPAAAGDLAYVIFTSGSTGTPKGVMIDHRGALNTVLDVNARYGIGADDAVFGLSSLSFDLSVYDLFGLLGAGGRVVLPASDEGRDPEAWLRQLLAARVTVWNTVPALMQMLMDYLDGADAPALPPLRVIMLSGDWIPVDLPARIRRWFPTASIYSLGGATEASIWSIDYRVGRVDPGWSSVPYGKALSNQQVRALKPDFTPCPIWVPGELYLGGMGLAHGYWRDPHRTAERFVSDPRSGERWYRTGDYGRLLPDGNLEFLGREDAQVKIQGYRIELGEIEARLKQHAKVKDALVIAQTHGHGKRLLAYVVPAGVGQEVDPKRAVRDPAALQAEAERQTFALEQHGRRRDLRTTAVVPLPRSETAELAIHLHLGEAPVTPIGAHSAIDFPALAKLLMVLAGNTLATQVLPKYRYPSAGSLYPVQTYLSVGRGDADLPRGSYYFDPIEQELHCLRAGSAASGNDVLLHLVSDGAAIAPLYGEHAAGFAALEAGYMAALLSARAPCAGLRLIRSPAQPDAEALRLGAQHRHLLSLQVLPGTADVARLPAFALSPVARKSYREFHPRQLQWAQIAALLPRHADPRIRSFLWLAEERVAGHASGCYALDPISGQLGSAALPFDAAQVFRFSRRLHAAASLALIHCGMPEQAVDAGWAGQLFMQRALAQEIGSCVCGGFDGELAKAELALPDAMQVLQVVFAGPVAAAAILAAPGNADLGSGNPSSLAAELSSALAEHLPAYMLPKRFQFLQALPLSSNGKVDLKTLPPPDDDDSVESAAPPTMSACASLLCEVLAQLLALDRVRLTDNFFEIGGDSLLAVRLAQVVRERLSVALPIRMVFATPMVGDLAAAIETLLAATPTTTEIAAPLAPISSRLRTPRNASEELVEL
jgi:amino acid adenylation domain-containing protein